MITMGRAYDNRGHISYEADTTYSASSNPTSLGQITIYGAEQSSSVPAQPGSSGSAEVQMTGGQPYSGSGTISVTVNGQTTSASLSGTISVTAVSQAIVNAISSSSLPVTAQAQGPNFILIAKTTGTATNYSLSVNSNFSFPVSYPSTLTGGTNGTPVSTTYDTGTVTATIAGQTASYTYGQNDNGSTIAQGLASAITSKEGSVLRASASGSTIELTSTSAGSIPVVPSVTDTSNGVFSSASFSTTYLAQLGYGYFIPRVGGYDAVGNVKSVTDSVTSVWSYNYDTLNRLIAGTSSSGPYVNQNACWSYDAFGNRLSQSLSTSACPTLPSVPTATASYNTANQVTFTTVNSATNGFTYDNSGNVINDNLNQYKYDAEGRVCAVSFSPISGGTVLTGYVYDAAGTRVAKETLSAFACNPAGSTLTNSYVLGPGGEEVTEFTISGGTATWAHSNVFAGGKLLATYNSTGTYFALNDWLGTKRVEYGSSPTGCVNSYSSLPYGDALSSNLGCPNDATEQHFTGKERDAESGLDYFGARYYASNMGRFMSPDWSAKEEPVPYAKLDNPQSLNLYGYVGNNPLSTADPDGHDGDVITDVWKGAAAGSAVQPELSPVLVGGAAVISVGVVIYQNWDHITNFFANAAPGGNGSACMCPIENRGASPPNPNGSKGAPDHQATADEEAAKMGPNGQREVRVETPGGSKGSRVIDAAKVENGKVTEATQVVRPNKNGTPPAREVRAAKDIHDATGVKPKLVPVRPLKDQQ